MFEIPKQETGSPLTFGHLPMYAAAPLIFTRRSFTPHASPESRAFLRHPREARPRESPPVISHWRSASTTIPFLSFDRFVTAALSPTDRPLRISTISSLEAPSVTGTSSARPLSSTT